MAEIQLEKTALGLELGSRASKRCSLGRSMLCWPAVRTIGKNRLEHGYWTYAWMTYGRACRMHLPGWPGRFRERYGTPLHTVGAMGVSGMMHGYLPFARDGAQLAAFRTWRNTTTERAAALLTERFAFNVPQRWSVAHLYQAILDGEPHARDIAYLTTLAGLCALAADGGKGAGRGRSVGHVPH